MDAPDANSSPPRTTWFDGGLKSVDNPAVCTKSKPSKPLMMPLMSHRFCMDDRGDGPPTDTILLSTLASVFAVHVLLTHDSTKLLLPEIKRTKN
ncbi:hypothetical protein PoB_002410100 [Plakobranchus ocellatus]|uniref:Uncharacterized protein n=1 Tax=Plakobranchus ocellatus TaxID=259542 RepID=A0AAV3ZED1_9GAST|nr:hypothetical protein PoB_002410100 [Plakobranchus ocellatus]